MRCGPRTGFTAALIAVTLLQLAGTPLASTADSDPRFIVRLTAREFTPGRGVDEAAIAATATPGEPRVHFLVQLDEIPSAADRARLAAGGLRLLDYVTGNAYIASTAPVNVSRVGALDGVRWAGPLRTDDKLAADVAAGQVPSWARTSEGRIVLSVQGQRDVSLAETEAVVRRHGGEVLDRVSLIPLVTAVFSPWSVRGLAAEDSVHYVGVASPPLSPDNDTARIAANTAPLPLAPYNLTGAGVTALVYDAGLVDQHSDFGTRVLQREGNPSVGQTRVYNDHATHVAGSLGGSGANSNGVDSAGNPNGGTPNQWAGVASGVGIRSFALEPADDPDLLFLHAGDLEANFTTAMAPGAGADLATMSLGHKPGNQCELFGRYTDVAILLDRIVRGSIANQQLIFTKSAGNEGDGVCGPFGTLPSPATTKNAIVVGSIDSEDGSVSDFSSRGPTAPAATDGRTKPDVAAPGCRATPLVGNRRAIKSTGFVDDDDAGLDDGMWDPPEARNAYVDGGGAFCGTSMAAPVVAGINALLYEQWRRSKGANTALLPHTAKALLVQGATDVAPAGPDFERGFGPVDATATVDIVRGDGTTDAIHVANTSGEADAYTFVSDGTLPLKATLAWSDPPATPLADDATLKNDLNLRVTAPDGTAFLPFLLDPTNPTAPATRGVDTRNNVEVVLGNAQAGTWTITVDGVITEAGPQEYTVVIGPERPPPGLTTCGIIWTGLAGTGAWNSPGNWNPNRVPAGDDYVCIPDMTPNVTIQHTTGATSIRGLASFEAIELTGGTLALTDVAAPSIVGTLTIGSSGTLAGAGTLTVLNQLTWIDGAMVDSGTTSVARGAVLNVNAPGFGQVELNGGRRLVIAGSGTWQAGTIRAGDGALVQVLGSLSVTGNNAFNWSGSGDRPRLHVLPSGTLAKTAPGAGTSVLDAFVEVDGTLAGNSGILRLTAGDGPGTHRGSFTAAAGGTVDFGGGDNELEPASTVGGLGTTRVSGGTVHVLGSWDVAGTTSVTSGTLTFDANARSVAMTVAGGIVGGTAVLTVPGTLTWTDGRMTDVGTTRIPVGGNLLVNTASSFVNVQLDGGRLLEILGTGTWQQGTITAGEAARIDVVGTLHVTGSNGLTFSSLGQMPVVHVTPTGKIEKMASGGTTTLGVFVVNQGIVRASAGSIDLTAGDGGTAQAGRFGGTGATAVVRFGNGTYTLGDGARFDGRVTIQGATLHVEGSAANDAGTTTTFLSGTLRGASTFTVSGGLVWTEGAMTDAGTTRIAPGGTLMINPPAAFNNVVIDGGRRLQIAGNATWPSGSIVGGDGALVEVSGTFSITGNNAFNWTSIGARPLLRVQNGGTLTKMAPGAGTSTFNAFMEVDGTASVTSGVLDLAAGSGTGDSNGSLTAGPGTTLEFGGGDHVLAAGSSVGGAGTARVSAGIVTTLGSWNVAGTTSVTGGTLSVGAAAQTAQLALAGGTIGGAETLTATGASTWTAGRMTDTGTTRIPVGATLLVNAATATFVTIDGGRRLEVAGIGTWQSGAITGGDGAVVDVAGTLNVTGNNNFNASGVGTRPTLRVAPGGLLAKIAPGGGTTNINAEVDVDGRLRVASGIVDLDGGLANYDTATDELTGGVFEVITTLRLAGAEVKTNAADVTLDGSGAFLDTSNQNGFRSLGLNAAGGELTLSGGKDLDVAGPAGGTFQNAGTLTLGAGSEFRSGTTFVNALGGIVLGNGTIKENLQNHGDVRPGLSPGELSVNGSYTQASTGILTAEIQGTAAGTFDRLSVAGPITLDGKLRIQTGGGFTPVEGNSFQILTFLSRNGTFATIENASLAGGLQYAPQYAGSPSASGDVSLLVETVQPPPETTIDGGPAGTTALYVQTYTFSSPAAGATFECRRDGGDWSACVSPKTYVDTVPGPHSLEVRAIGPGGTDATPARRDTRAVRPFAVDFDSDARADVALFRPATGGWHRPGQPTVYHGRSGDVPLPGQWDADPAVDVAVYRNGGWYVQGNPTTFFGTGGDIPVPADFDGNGVLEIALFRPANGGWYRPGQPTVFFGRNGDIPLVGQWDADAPLDFAVYRAGAWVVQGNPTTFFGLGSDVPSPADFTGDGRLDVALFRPSNGGWFRPGEPIVFFGINGDLPLLGQWDADAPLDFAVYRAGAWHVQGNPTTFFGTGADVP